MLVPYLSPRQRTAHGVYEAGGHKRIDGLVPVPALQAARKQGGPAVGEHELSRSCMHQKNRLFHVGVLCLAFGILVLHC